MDELALSLGIDLDIISTSELMSNSSSIFLDEYESGSYHDGCSETNSTLVGQVRKPVRRLVRDKGRIGAEIGRP